MAGNVVGHQQSKVDGVAEESSISDALDIAPESRFECPICLAWLRDPVVTACGHRFCSNCIDLWLKKENACCPVDNLKLTRDDIFPDNFTRREISQQRTKCPNIVRGCLQELSPLDVETHLLNCEFRIPESHLPESEKLHCLFGSFGCPHKFEDEPELQRHLENDTQNHFKLFSNICKNLKISEASGSASSAIAQQANFWDPPSKSEVNNHEGSVDSMQGLIK
ncbi:PREDICTED: TNF receptor-associated factor 6-like [Nicrophorus vespilloides]|uniref:TNF receptor-associated factor 6-like n=1 Tax=Nicrophorus vespilloides TaxID=110193 RepID=A0ABM1M228_NICVS|nr:PREDICTED: TNF receptor-associated factor 6-like [Nicrophorus vespilloides]